MIDKILQPFDFITKMPIQEQCLHAVGVSFTGFVIAAILRESCKDTRVRYAARALGAGAFFMVAVYSMMITEKYVKLESAYQTVKAKKSSGVSAEKVITLTTSYGDKIEFGGSDSGLRIRATDCESGGCRTGRSSVDPKCSGIGITTSRLGLPGSIDAIIDGVHAPLELSQWWRSIRNASDRSDSGCFEFSKETQGEDF